MSNQAFSNLVAKANEMEAVKKFLSIHDNFSPSQKLIMTPIVYSPRDFEYLRKIYRQSAQKVGYFYTPTVFRFSFAYKVKSYAFFVASAYHFKEWEEMLFANYQIVLDYEQIQPHPKLLQFADKELKYFQKPLEKGCHELVKIVVDGKVYGWKLPDPYYSRTPV